MFVFIKYLLIVSFNMIDINLLKILYFRSSIGSKFWMLKSLGLFIAFFESFMIKLEENKE